MTSLKLRIAGAVIVLLSSFFSVNWLIKLPEQLREEGRQQQIAIEKAASNMANIKSWRDLVTTEQQLQKERQHHADQIAKHEEKFNRYVADVRAGRIAGLRVQRSDLCTANNSKAESTSGTIEATTVRLPREVEEGLFRFAHDRDQIILDFEAFKNEVRTAKCFAD